MSFAELTPEGKLYNAIFGEAAWTEGVDHWLSDAGRKAINDLLDKFVDKPHQRITKAWCERAVKVIRLRFGFEPRTAEEKAKRPGPSDARTLEEVGVYFAVTRERIRQIEGRMLRILRHPVYATGLRQYLKGPA